MIIFIAAAALLVALILQMFLYSKYAYKNVGYKCYFSSSEVFENESLLFVEEIENKKLLPIAWLKMDLHIDDSIIFCDTKNNENTPLSSALSFFTLGGYQKIRREWKIRPQKRGLYRISDIYSLTSDIVGLTYIEKTFESESYLSVLPASLKKKDIITLKNYSIGESPKDNMIFCDPVSIYKINKYTGNESFNKINWKASAKRQELMVNIEQPVYMTKGTIILNIPNEQELKNKHILSASIERAVKIAASLNKIFGENSLFNMISNGTVKDNDIETLRDTKKINLRNAILPDTEEITVTKDIKTLHARNNLSRILSLIENTGTADTKRFLEIIYENIHLLPANSNIIFITCRIDNEISDFYREMKKRSITVTFIVPRLSYSTYTYENDSTIPVIFM